MKKVLKISPIFCLMFVFIFLLSACSLGTYSVAFIDYNGKLIGIRTYSNGESVNNTPSPPSRIGFTFAGWDQNITPPENIENFKEKVDYNMYAKYQINTEGITFGESGCRISWYGSTTSSFEISFKAGQPKYILVQDLVSSSNFSKIEVLPTEGSDFICQSFKVYNNNGYPADGKSVFVSTWEPSSISMPTLGEYNFVLEIISSGFGNAIVKLT